MFYILSVEIQYLCRFDMAFIEPMHRNKPIITYLLTVSSFFNRWHCHYYPRNKANLEPVSTVWKCVSVIFILCTYEYVAYIHSYLALTCGNCRTVALSYIHGFNIQYNRDERFSRADLQQATPIAGNVTIAKIRLAYCVVGKRMNPLVKLEWFMDIVIGSNHWGA